MQQRLILGCLAVILGASNVRKPSTEIRGLGYGGCGRGGVAVRMGSACLDHHMCGSEELGLVLVSQKCTPTALSPRNQKPQITPTVGGAGFRVGGQGCDALGGGGRR